MRIRSSLIAALSGLAILLVSTASARTHDTTTSLYQLEDRSTYADGCFGLCACPIRVLPLRGTFRLKRLDPDPLFQNYDVSEVKWVVPLPAGDLTITGSGKYRVGGEVAIMHQLSLDLSVVGDPPVHFDSDLVPGGGSFPLIIITISRHGMAQCLDTALSVVAAPAVAGLEGEHAESGLRRVFPNPSRSGAALELMLQAPGTVSAGIFDAQGRTVRTIERGTWLEAGPHFLHWDGTRDDGAGASAGLYFARVKVGGIAYQRAVVKLEGGAR